MGKDAWQPRRVIEADYRKALKKLTSCLSNLISGLEVTTADAIMDALGRYVTLDFFRDLARAAARKMVTMLRVDGAKAWRDAARKSSRGTEIYKALRDEMKGPVGTRVHRIIEENARLISTFSDEIIGHRVAKSVLEMQQKGLRSTAMAQELAKQFPEIAQSRIDLIARTETSKASTALTQARAENMGIDWYVWRTSRDARVRPAHMKMDGVLCRWTDPPAPEVLAGEKSEGSYHAGGIFNCFPESVSVSLANGSDCVWRRNYSGRIFRLVCVDGSSFEATPNHPILTVNGWRPIQFINKGDNIINAKFDNRCVMDGHINDVNASFGEIFEAFKSFTRSTRGLIGGFAFDFHGDGSRKNIDVVWTNGFLPFDTDPPCLKRVGEFPLSNSNGRIGLTSICSNNHIGKSFISSATNQNALFFDTEFGHPNLISFGNASELYSVPGQDFTKRLAGGSIFPGKHPFGCTSQVIRDNISLRDIESSGTPVAFGDLKTTSAEMLGNWIGTILKNNGSILEHHPASYHPLRVIENTFRDFSGHVFGLQSFNGWFTIAPAENDGNRIIVKNCRCFCQPLLDMGQVRWPAKVYAGGSVERMTQAEFQRRFGEHRRMAA